MEPKNVGDNITTFSEDQSIPGGTTISTIKKQEITRFHKSREIHYAMRLKLLKASMKAVSSHDYQLWLLVNDAEEQHKP